MTAPALISLTSDFGLADSYVAEMKAALLAGAAGAPLLDVTHDLPPGDIWGGAWTLRRVWTRVPPGSVHLCVIDPTVGSDRRAIAARAADRWLVGPDNGLLTFLEAAADGVPISAAWELRRPSRGAASTFHGRDLFAPAAASIAAGRPEAALAGAIDPEGLVRLPVPRPRRGRTGVSGMVVHVDRFGNLVTDIPVPWAGERPRVRLDGRSLAGWAASYADVAPGEALLTRGSAGTLEISVRDGRAAEALGVARGDEVRVEVSGAG